MVCPFFAVVAGTHTTRGSIQSGLGLVMKTFLTKMSPENSWWSLCSTVSCIASRRTFLRTNVTNHFNFYFNFEQTEDFNQNKKSRGSGGKSHVRTMIHSETCEVYKLKSRGFYLRVDLFTSMENTWIWTIFGCLLLHEYTYHGNGCETEYVWGTCVSWVRHISIIEGLWRKLRA